MRVTRRKLDTITPYENNPRTIEDDAVIKLAAIITEYGWRQPIVVDADGVIIVGHTRYLAAQKLGLEKVPVHVASNLTPDQVRRYRIEDNKSHELTDWNLDLLPIELEAIRDEADDGNVDLIAFDPNELSVHLGYGDPADADKRPRPPSARVTNAGDNADSPDANTPPIPSTYQVLIECNTEELQAKVYEAVKGFGDDGANVRMLTID